MPDWTTTDLIFGSSLFLLDALAIGRAFWRGQSVERTLAWIFAILALPGVGAVAYLIVAGPSLRRTTRRKRQATKDVRATLEVGAESPPGEASLLTLAVAVTGLSATSDNQATLLSDNDDAFRRIEEALAGAERFIWAEYYAIHPDLTGGRFLDLLTAKAKEGVEVRLLYDAIGSMSVSAEKISAIKAAGGRAKVFLPLNPLRRRWSIHLRNHRKLIVIDGRIGFTGGMNIGDEYSARLTFRKKRRRHFFRDTHLALEGPAVAQLAQTFIEDWTFASGERLALPKSSKTARAGNAKIAILPSGPDQEHNASALVYFGLLGLARQSLYLTSPYFVPDEPTFRALLCAALRGVDTRILLPARNDVALVGLAARTYFPALLNAGVRIFEYKPSMLHAKTLVVDGQWSVVGSANLDIRSFQLNFELGALILGETFAAELEQRFEADLRQSRELSASRLARTRWPQRLKERAARLLSPLL